jgi:hypothetical protein
MRYFLLGLSALVIFAASCNKKAPQATNTNENILRSGRWKVSGGSVTYKLPSGKDTDIRALNNLATCNQDDYLVFDSLFNAVIYSGGTKCNAASPDSVRFTWSLTNGGNGINFYHPDGLVYLLQDSLKQYYIDTISTNPVVLDTISWLPLVLDSIYPVQYTNPTIVDTSVIAATFTNFSSSAFTINYGVLSYYWDTTLNHRFGTPVLTRDTVRFSVQYTKF